MRIYFVTHPEVVIDPEINVVNWSLSERGLARMQSLLRQPWLDDISSVYCSAEKKAVDGAKIVCAALNLPVCQLRELGENDRSATGYLPAAEFELVADQFFSEPTMSVRGWETAIAAQSRIVQAVNRVREEATVTGSILIISHGAVGALLYCNLNGYDIDRKYDQPGAGGGNYFSFDRHSNKVFHAWRPIEAA